MESPSAGIHESRATAVRCREAVSAVRRRLNEVTILSFTCMCARGVRQCFVRRVMHISQERAGKRDTHTDLPKQRQRWPDAGRVSGPTQERIVTRRVGLLGVFRVVHQSPQAYRSTETVTNGPMLVGCLARPSRDSGEDRYPVRVIRVSRLGVVRVSHPKCVGCGCPSGLTRPSGGHIRKFTDPNKRQNCTRAEQEI